MAARPSSALRSREMADQGCAEMICTATPAPRPGGGCPALAERGASVAPVPHFGGGQEGAIFCSSDARQSRSSASRRRRCCPGPACALRASLSFGRVPGGSGPASWSQQRDAVAARALLQVDVLPSIYVDVIVSFPQCYRRRAARAILQQRRRAGRAGSSGMRVARRHPSPRLMMFQPTSALIKKQVPKLESGPAASGQRKDTPEAKA
ncbi:unnamed protein product [Prorocentrum cordatum]|uniref:Uncharacterized protein n=1 Tax=Prorocentrum cordatum TaxID=2364126 RepID=A0ABN9UAP8_9DINO|nr:unnamed protein product [Polarella glacialis]